MEYNFLVSSTVVYKEWYSWNTTTASYIHTRVTQWGSMWSNRPLNQNVSISSTRGDSVLGQDFKDNRAKVKADI